MPSKRRPLFYLLGWIVLGGCSQGGLGVLLETQPSGPLEEPAPEPSTMPDQTKLLKAVQDIAEKLKLPGMPEMSRLRRASPLGAADWMFCLRGSTFGTSVQTVAYAVFVRPVPASDIIHYRAAVKIDECERDQYEPLANFAPPPPPPPPKAPAGQRSR